MNVTTELKLAAREAGADLVGVADLAPFRESGSLLPPDAFERFRNAVAVAVRLDDAIIDGIQSAPTPAYAEHYRRVNRALDRITGQVARWVSARGFSAYAVPASETLDKANHLGGISHKAVARLAGIGWQGKSLLIVSPRFGPRIRLSTLLTNMPLMVDKPLKNRCGSCGACATACPAAAIKNVRTLDRYSSRDDALHFNRCVEQTGRFKAEPDIGARICGVCVSVCPFGKPNRSAGARFFPGS